MLILCDGFFYDNLKNLNAIVISLLKRFSSICSVWGTGGEKRHSEVPVSLHVYHMGEIRKNKKARLKAKKKV